MFSTFTLLPLLALAAISRLNVSARPTNSTGGYCKVRSPKHYSSTVSYESASSLYDGNGDGISPSTTSLLAAPIPTDLTRTSSTLDMNGESAHQTRTRSIDTTHSAVSGSTSDIYAASTITYPGSIPDPVPSAPPGTITAGSTDADALVKLHSDFRAMYGELID
jgi:hypothetical protein